MFGKILKHPIMSWLILVGFLAYIVRLFMSGAITLYIHPRYTWFSLAMAAVGLVVLGARAVMARNRNRTVSTHHHGPEKDSRGVFVNCLVILVLILAWMLPPQTLSSETVGRRGVRVPIFESNIPCPAGDYFAKPFEHWWFDMDNHSMECYHNQPIEFTGFVIGWSPDYALPDDMFYLGRLAMSCCAIDAQPFALPVVGGDGKHTEGQWYTVRGTLEIVTTSGTKQLVIRADTITPVDQPSDPYMYIES